MSLFQSAKDIIAENSALAEPAAMASRLIARRCHSFRVQPSFACFRKMNVALCRLKEMNFAGEVQRMRKSITMEKIDGFYHLPTKENIRYFLIHLQSVAKILVRIVQCAKDAHRMFVEMLHRSAFIETISMFFAVTAQVWTHCIRMCKSVAIFYNGLSQFYHTYSDPANDSELPHDLIKWLADDWTELIDVSTEANANQRHSFYGNVILFNGAEAAGAFDIAETQAQTETDGQQPHRLPQFKPKITMNKIDKAKRQNHPAEDSTEKVRRENVAKRRMAEVIEHIGANASEGGTSIDVGERIDRNAFQKNQTIKKVFTLDLNQFKKIQHIRDFIEAEDSLRAKNSPKYSNGVPVNRWNQFKANCERLYILGQEKLVIRKFRNLWDQTKCKST